MEREYWDVLSLPLDGANYHSPGQRPIDVNLSLPLSAKWFMLMLSQARRAERLWPTAKAVGWLMLVNDEARQPTGDRLLALRPIILSPLRGLLMTLIHYPMASPWATFYRPSADGLSRPCTS